MSAAEAHATPHARAGLAAMSLAALGVVYGDIGTSPIYAEHPFFRLAPSWALIPLVALTTLATVIASQAVVSGAFSLTRRPCSSATCREWTSSTPR